MLDRLPHQIAGSLLLSVPAGASRDRPRGAALLNTIAATYLALQPTAGAVSGTAHGFPVAMVWGPSSRSSPPCPSRCSSTREPLMVTLLRDQRLVGQRR